VMDDSDKDGVPDYLDSQKTILLLGCCCLKVEDGRH
jgi:hypothetical protein